MKNSLFRHPFWHEPGVLISFTASALVNIGVWAAFLFFIKSSPFPLILHYTPYAGIDLLGGRNDLLFVPAAGSLLLAGDFFLARHLYVREHSLSLMVVYSAVAVEILIAVAGIALYRINA